MRAHACNTHKVYRLSCADFDALRQTGICGRCQLDTPLLAIDHDHKLGMMAVRGAVCTPCNSRLGRVDSGEVEPDELDAAYLANPWHVGRPIHFVDDGRTTIRAARIEDRLWAESQATAKAQGENVVDAIRRALSAYNTDPNAFDAAIAAIRGGAR